MIYSSAKVTYIAFQIHKELFHFPQNTLLISRLTQPTTDEGSFLTQGRMQIDMAQKGVLVIQTHKDKDRKVFRKEAINTKAIDTQTL